ncbi:transposase [Achromobacter sp. KS-M25]|nr:transposase [Achromobacter aestuarii]
MDELHDWMMAHQQKAPEGSMLAHALEYSLNRCVALIHYLEDGNVPTDSIWVENQIRSRAAGRSNWLFAGLLRAGLRAAAVISLVRSARLRWHDPSAYLKDVLRRLTTQRQSEIGEFRPHG